MVNQRIVFNRCWYRVIVTFCLFGFIVIPNYECWYWHRELWYWYGVVAKLLTRVLRLVFVLLQAVFNMILGCFFFFCNVYWTFHKYFVNRPSFKKVRTPFSITLNILLIISSIRSTYNRMWNALLKRYCSWSKWKLHSRPVFLIIICELYLRYHD